MRTAQVALAPTVSRAFLLHHRICPMRLDDDGVLVVATATGAPSDAISEIARAYGRRVRPYVLADSELERLVERLTSGHSADAEESTALDIQLPAGAESATADVRDLVNQAPVVRYVNLLIRDAHAAGASDIHLEASERGLSARFRLDGVLSPAHAPPPHLQHAVVSRIKLLADLDIAERRRAQDGRIRVRLDSQELDLRIATMPTMHGESMVLRLLDRAAGPVALTDLGLGMTLHREFGRMLARPHGLLLVTGPTGSGKTSTLYAGLRSRDAVREKIITIEDPIEYQLPGITQVPVRAYGGVSFATALRAILRQDPDVVMIGEMRDSETAQIAVQAALTGHLVLATLHTNDACAAVPRLLDLGVPPFLVAATLSGVLAQRLVRRLCLRCRVSAAVHPALLNVSVDASEVVAQTFGPGTGCEECRGTGYRGRIGIFELLSIGECVRAALQSPHGVADLRRPAEEDGLVPLRRDAWRKLQEGLTSVEEALRVLES